MGFQLWISPNTGIRRKGTTFKEIQDIFINNITTKFIYEPIYSCRLDDVAIYVKNTLEDRDFDVIGVIDENNDVFGYALKEEIENDVVSKFTHKIELENIVSDSTPIIQLLNILSAKSYCFVIESSKIVGIVTRADINKPIVRIYIFGLISLFELHLNFWINEYHKDESWKNEIAENRLNESNNLFANRKGNNEELTLLECLQFCDKRDILKNTNDFIGKFNFSRKKFERLLKDAEKIRNELAHSQNSIIANLDWERFVSTVSDIESFLHHSEETVEEKIRLLDKN